MELSQDLNELLELFLSREVSFIVVGAHALAFHGVPRFTGDLDLLVQRDNQNAGRIMEALVDFGFGGLGLTEGDFIAPDQAIQLGNPVSSRVSGDRRSSTAAGSFLNDPIEDIEPVKWPVPET